MRVVRLYDPAREPQGWMQIIRPSEFAAFATLADSSASCDADGVPTATDDASCIIFSTLTDAEIYCRERVERDPRLRFDVRDAGGMLRPPLLTIVHPSRADTVDGSARTMRHRTYAAIAMFGAAPVLFWYDWALHGGLIIMPTIVGINLVLIAIRLLVMNAGDRAAESARRARVAQAHDSRASASSPTDERPDGQAGT